jgi:hypothetical protein
VHRRGQVTVGRSCCPGTERLPRDACRAGTTATTGGHAGERHGQVPAQREGRRSAPRSALRRPNPGRDTDGGGDLLRHRGQACARPCSTFGTPEVRSRHRCQRTPGPGHRYGCLEASTSQISFRRRIGGAGKLAGRSVRRLRPTRSLASRAGSAVGVSANAQARQGRRPHGRANGRGDRLAVSACRAHRAHSHPGLGQRQESQNASGTSPSTPPGPGTAQAAGQPAQRRPGRSGQPAVR